MKDFKVVSTAIAALMISGCSTTVPQDVSRALVTTDDVKPHSDLRVLLSKELSERTGVKYKVEDISAAKKELKRISISALARYNNTVPEDVGHLLLKPIFLNNSKGDFKMRDIGLVIARGDSRIVDTSDIRALFSGVTSSLRVTLALDDSIWINGTKVGYYDPSSKNYYDTKVPAFKQGTISLRVSY